MRILRALSYVVLCAFLAFAATASAASFDCDTAKAAVEKHICAVPELSRLDEDMAAVYERALKNATHSEDVRTYQRRWLSTRNRCAATACLEEEYRARIGDLERFASLGESLGTQSNSAAERKEKSSETEEQTSNVCDFLLQRYRSESLPRAV